MEYKRQWRQLLVLTAVHFVLDMYPGVMHTVLPALQDSFALNVAAGAALLTIFLVASNLVQVVIGHLRPYQHKPLLLYVGIALTCSILLFGLVEAGAGALWWLSLIALAAGAGVGISHPEGLRAVHALEGITPAVSSSVFMAGGVFGFAFGGVVGTHLWELYGVKGLLPLCGLSLVVLASALIARVRLAVDRDPSAKSEIRISKSETKLKAQESEILPPSPCGGLPLVRGRVNNVMAAQGGEVPFWAIFMMAALTASSIQVLTWIVPQHISHIGANLTEGGRTVSLFTLAGGVGGMWWARSAARRGELKTIITMLAVGLVFVLLYLGLLRHSLAAATAALTMGGFFCYGTYPIMVGLARKSRGPNLGRRMGLIVGGIWLVACVLPMLLGKPAQLWGTGWILYCTPAGFAGALVLALALVRRNS